MLAKKSSKVSTENLMPSIFLIINIFVTLFCTFKLLEEVMGTAAFSNFEVRGIWSITFFVAAVSILVGALFSDRFYPRMRFLFFWTVIGIISFIIPVFIADTVSGVIIISVLLNVPLVFGLPMCLAEFADNTAVEKRTRYGGTMLLLIMGFSAFTTSLMTENIQKSLLILIGWRGLSLFVFLFSDLDRRPLKKWKKTSFASILNNLPFTLYLIPWIMFSLVNFLAAPLIAEIQSADFIYLSRLITNLLAGVAAVLGGFLSDIVGRKRVAIVGFIMLGLGYAVLGIYPLSLFCWYLFAVMDGIAWGLLYVIFVTTIWGDLAYGKPSEKYYALGSLPYLLSSFLGFTEVGSIIANTISPFAIFSFVAFFLFLAVLPLMFAPETLPEKKIKERELKKYIDKAEEVKKKYD